LKPVYEIDIAPGAHTCLRAVPLLLSIPESKYHHTTRKLRPPLGIYNVSISRIASRLIALCSRFELYTKRANIIADLDGSEELRAELIDYLELAIYAAAEHVDDIESIAMGLFHDKQYERNTAYKLLQKELKRLKRFVSITANVIKHRQARIRVFVIEMDHAGIKSCLHGYFIEGVENGIVGPSPILDGTQDCFSIPTFIWEIIHFVLGTSRALHDFLIETVAASDKEISPASDLFSKAIVAAARLPLYTFGEVHPFERATTIVTGSDGNVEPLKSGLYGSIVNRWDPVATPIFGRIKGYWEGDGVTRTFQLPRPRSVGLTRWH